MTEVLKQQMKKFWGRGWVIRDRKDTDAGTREQLAQEVEARRSLLVLEGSEAVCEMGDSGLRGKSVLEIGCGAGFSSIIFARDGAHVTASDLTNEAVEITKEKFELLGLPGAVVQADAEDLPFDDNSFDIVFSSGVLHHTPNGQKAVDEIYRVLKPGGDAVVMLYAKWSFHYLVYLSLVRGILLGERFRYGESWLGHATELAWRTDAEMLNPITKVYSGRRIRALFKKFKVITLRKYSFHWPDLFPGIYNLWRRPRARIGQTDVILPSRIEKTIGRFGGFDLVIHVQKP